MGIRMSGMVSGLDTESIVSAMVSTYVAKKQKYQKAQTKLSWKQDAWKALNTKIKSLYDAASSLKYSSAYAIKKTTVSDPTKASVTASGSALNGSQTLEIRSLAKSGYLTGAQLKSGTTANTTLGELGYSGDDDAVINVKVGGKSTDIKVGKDTKISDLVKQMNDAGVRASFDAANGRMFVSAKDSGTANDFSLTGGNTAGLDALFAAGLSVNATANQAAYVADGAFALNTDGESYFQLDDKGNVMKDANGKVLTNGTYDAAKTQEYIENTLKTLSEAYKDNAARATENTELTARINYTEAKNAVEAAKADGKAELIGLMEMANQSAFIDEDGNTYTNREAIVGKGGSFGGYRYYNTDADGNRTDVTERLAEDGKQFSTVADRITELAKEQGLITETEDDKGKKKTDATAFNTLKNQVKTVAAFEGNDLYNEADKVPYTDEELQAAKDTVAANKEAIAANNATIAANSYWDVKDYTAYDEEGLKDLAAKITGKIGTAADVATGATGVSYNSTASRVNAQDAVIFLNDAEFTSSSNNFNINGLSIHATDVTDQGKKITLTTATDTQGLYDKVKDFLTQYNSIINEMNSLYNADSARKYEPLTDDEKSAMSDSEVEKWEAKIKDSLLRRDTTLGSIMNAMTNAMAKGYTVNGKTYSLSSFGINTLGYLNAAKNENYAFHIDGDADDTYTSGKTDKLMAALESDPDAVVDFMKQLTSGLYDAMDAKMKSTTMSSAYTVYNDKEMANEYSSYTDLIKDWEKRITDMEDRYYKKFAAMEKALSQLQNSTSSFSSLLGG